MNDNHYVFCIGFHKTGTSSLTVALTHLGYNVTGLKKQHLPHVNQALVYQTAVALVDGGEYNAFKDNPWPLIYRELDERYPGSKFILTIRPTEAWIASVVRHFGSGETAMRTWIYGAGAPKGNEDLYIERYGQHNREVIAYFQTRSDDLLVLNFAEGDGWEKLCRFLEHEIPAHPFPHANQGRILGESVKDKWW